MQALGGEKITFDFIVRIFTGDNGGGLLISLSVWTFSKQQFSTASHFAIKVERGFVSVFLPWLSNKPANTVCAERIWNYVICTFQCQKKSLTFCWHISKFALNNSFSALITLLLLSEQSLNFSTISNKMPKCPDE